MPVGLQKPVLTSLPFSYACEIVEACAEVETLLAMALIDCRKQKMFPKL